MIATCSYGESLDSSDWSFWRSAKLLASLYSDEVESSRCLMKVLSSTFMLLYLSPTWLTYCPAAFRAYWFYVDISSSATPLSVCRLLSTFTNPTVLISCLNLWNFGYSDIEKKLSSNLVLNIRGCLRRAYKNARIMSIRLSNDLKSSGRKGFVLRRGGI